MESGRETAARTQPGADRLTSANGGKVVVMLRICGVVFAIRNKDGKLQFRKIGQGTTRLDQSPALKLLHRAGQERVRE